MKHDMTKRMAGVWLTLACCLSAGAAGTALPQTPVLPGFIGLSSPSGRTFVGRLAPHDSIYFLFGADDPAAKFQFSFKYRLLDLQEDVPAATTRHSLFFGYTQRSLWDIGADSSPFFDSSYIPEIFLESSRKPVAHPAAGPAWLGLQAGARHESNGRSGLESRSLNTLYVRPVFALGQVGGWKAILAPEVFGYVSDLDDNPDLADYRGYIRLRGALIKVDGPALVIALYSGKRLDRLSVQLDLTLPVTLKAVDLEAYLMLQYFNGHSESLRTYNRVTDGLRLGFAVVR